MLTINVLSKNKKKKSSENEHFYSREILLYIAWACLRNVESALRSNAFSITMCHI